MARKKENLLGEMKKNVKKVAEQSKDINEKQPTQLSIDKIKVNEGNYFNMNDDSKYEALKLSIERVGILSPLTVKENGVDDKGDKQYLIISGVIHSRALYLPDALNSIPALQLLIDMHFQAAVALMILLK